MIDYASLVYGLHNCLPSNRSEFKSHVMLRLMKQWLLTLLLFGCAPIQSPERQRNEFTYINQLVEVTCHGDSVKDCTALTRFGVPVRFKCTRYGCQVILEVRW